MKTLATVCCFFFVTILCAQDIYIVNNLTTLKKIDVSNFEVTDLFTIGVTVSDLAFTANGTLYGITPLGDIIEINIAEESFSVIAQLPAGDTYTGLVANENNELLTSKNGSEELYRYNIDTQNISLVTTGIATPGDFTFYKGNIIYPNFDNDFIRAFDGNILINIGCSVNQLYTFVSIFNDCNDEVIYGIDSLGNVYNYDIENENVTLIIFLGSETGTVFGGATMSEYRGAACTTKSIAEVSCTLSTQPEIFQQFTIYPNPVTSKLFVNSHLNQQELHYTIVDVYGKVVLSDVLKRAAIAVDKLQEGLYFITILNKKGVTLHTEKLLKKSTY